jgi:purine-nucleoside phosphorylase
VYRKNISKIQTIKSTGNKIYVFCIAIKIPRYKYLPLTTKTTTSMHNLLDSIQITTDFIKARIQEMPEVAVILGSGLGNLTQSVVIKQEIPYADIPHFPVSTVQGHAGKLIFGKLGGKPAMLMAGRFHYYEGYDMATVTFPVRVMKALGIHTMIVSNAAGGMNKNFKVGDIVLIQDHINLFPEHPLRGPNDERLGVRFLDMSEPYNLGLLQKAQQIAQRQGVPVHTGIYAGLQGPTFETRAEYHWLHTIGADLVGMSTVPEVIVAIHSGMRVFGASIVTDLGIREERNLISHEEVLAAAHAAAPKLAALVATLVAEMD